MDDSKKPERTQLNEISIRPSELSTQGLLPRIIPLGLRGQTVIAEPTAASQHSIVGSALSAVRRSPQQRVSIIRRIAPTSAPGVYACLSRARCVVKPYVPPPDLVPPFVSLSFPAMRRPLTPFNNNGHPARPGLSRPSSGVADPAVCRTVQLLPGQIPVCYPLDRLHNALVKILGERYLNLLDEFSRNYPHLLDIDDETMKRYLYLDFARM